MNTAIILSGGVGSRMGLDIPKQYIEVDGNPIFTYCLKTFLSCDFIDMIVIGVATEWLGFVKNAISKLTPSVPIYYSIPGDTRQLSIYNALVTAKNHGVSSNDIVIIHDAARPLVSESLIRRCINSCGDVDGILPVVPVKDTIYFSQNGKDIDALIDRSSLWAGQAPEAFVFGKYMKAHEEVSREELLKINGSTEIAIKAGMVCKMIEGDPLNFKITTLDDLSNFKSILNN